VTLEWTTDSHGDALWDRDTFVGCIYARDWVGGLEKGWRVLDRDLRKVIDVEPASASLIGDLRLEARAHLEGMLAPLPSAAVLLDGSKP
jgi:hypothetical protein